MRIPCNMGILQQSVAILGWFLQQGFHGVYPGVSTEASTSLLVLRGKRAITPHEVIAFRQQGYAADKDGRPPTVQGLGFRKKRGYKGYIGILWG